MAEREPNAYDQALAQALDESDEAVDVRERLLSGAASDADRQHARASLDDTARRRFELAHPLQPRPEDLEVEAEEIELPIGDLASAKGWKDHGSSIRELLSQAAQDAEGAAVVVQLRVRLTSDK